MLPLLQVLPALVVVLAMLLLTTNSNQKGTIRECGLQLLEVHVEEAPTVWCMHTAAVQAVQLLIVLLYSSIAVRHTVRHTSRFDTLSIMLAAA